LTHIIQEILTALGINILLTAEAVFLRMYLHVAMRKVIRLMSKHIS
jgi:hypothetical protein